MRTRIAAFVVMMAAVAGVAAAQDSVDAARELYAAAAYEDALAVLNRLHPADRPAVEARSIDVGGARRSRNRHRFGTVARPHLHVGVQVDAVGDELDVPVDEDVVSRTLPVPPVGLARRLVVAQPLSY